MITPLGSRFEAWYYDGRTPSKRAVTVELAADELRIERPGEELLVWSYTQLQTVCDGADGEPVRLEPKGGVPGEALVVDSGSFAEAMRQHAPARRAGREWLEFRGWRPVLAACAAIAAVACAFYFWGVRAAADAAARVAPPFLEERLGRAVVNILAPEPQRCSNQEREKLLARVTDRLTAAAGRSGYQFKVIWADRPIANAFAAPGGYIVVFQGLLSEMQTPEELAGVLAHEMQHVVNRHATRALARDISARTLLSLIAFDASGTPGGIRGAVELGNLSYQRSDEEQADLGAVALLQRARIDPRGLETLLRRLQLNGQAVELGYLSSHPAIEERIAKMEARVSRSAPAAVPLMTPEEWAAARSVCGH